MERVRDGVPFSEAFLELGALVPPIARPILAVGERTGRLGKALEHLKRETKLLAEQEKRFEYSIFNPGITIPFALCLPLIIVGYVTESPIIALAYVVFAISGSISSASSARLDERKILGMGAQTQWLVIMLHHQNPHLQVRKLKRGWL